MTPDEIKRGLERGANLVAVAVLVAAIGVLVWVMGQVGRAGP